MNEMKYITINKNRGWRGLAEIAIFNEDKKLTTKHIFSFSQRVWDDMINHNIVVIASEVYYYVIKFNPTDRLPRRDQQRSVLIKNFTSEIIQVNKYEKSKWGEATGEEWQAILNFRRNNNNHTTSDWNCIGLRVIPSI